VFARAAKPEMLEKAFLERFVGVYELAGALLTVALRGDSTLQASVPGQPDYVLVPYKGTEFRLKGLSGFSIEFKRDASGTVTGAVVTQPNGVFIAERKADDKSSG
jgi:hypothetical protein